MEYIRLGQTDQTVSRLGFGGCPLGGYGWGSTDEKELRAALRFAIDKGVTFFDTADIYGFGESETILGEEINRHDQVVIATKFGVRRIGSSTIYDNSATWIEEALHASLKRIKRDTVDLYQLHYWDGHTPMNVILETVDRLRTQGKLRWFGFTNLDPRMHLNEQLPHWIVSFSYECSLLQQKYRSVIDSLGENHGLTFLSWGSLAQGALSGKYAADHKFDPTDRRSREVYAAFHGEGLRRRESMLDAMRDIQKDHPSYTLAQMAIRWILDRYAGSVALVGVKRTSQIADAIGAMDWSLSRTDIERLTRMATASQYYLETEA
jgi:myo-inositol catabolism protein IolS